MSRDDIKDLFRVIRTLTFACQRTNITFTFNDLRRNFRP